MSEATTCKSCGTPVHDRFCSACGEKVLTPADHTLKHYLGALLNAFTFADSKFWNTLKAVVLRPGELSAAYMDGRRVKYMRPVGFFFLANFIYFLAPVFETFNTNLNSQINYQQHSHWTRPMVEAHLEANDISLEEFSARYDPASSNNAKLLLVFMVFALFVPLSIIYVRKRSYISAYVTAAFELMAFHVWVSTVFLGLFSFCMVMLVSALGGSIEFLLADEYLLVPVLLLHLWVTIGIGRRFFRCTWFGSIWRSLAMVFGLQFSLLAYRIALFVLTFWQVS